VLLDSTNIGYNESRINESHERKTKMPPFCVLAVVVLIIVVVYWALFRNTKTPLPDIHVKHEETEPIEPAVEVSATTPKLKASTKPVVEASVTPPKPKTPVKPDDLTKIEGIGPKVNQALQNTGITTFAQLAKTNETKLKKILDDAGYGFMNPASWAEQAKLASKGNFDGLKELQSNLKAGRKAG